MKRSFAVFLILGLAVLPAAAALPGTKPPASVLAPAARHVRSSSERAKLVWIASARITNVESFTSKAGKKHVGFTLTAGGETHDAIAYQGDWTANDLVQLRTGAAGLVGFWTTYQGQPSFTTKAILKPQGAVPSSFAANAEKAPDGTPLKKIAGASITNVETFTSQAGKKHLRFRLTVSGKSYAAIIYEGNWDAAMLARLKTGRATLIGYWDKYGNDDSFIVRQVTK
ncbi:MAG TPA: hypothetical protein VHN99_07205 [Deinococcales bacterium]|nr:hypothetical protein [Deinococcales bacterium]